MQYGIYVGNAPGNTEVVTSSILTILEAKADQETIRVALGVLAQGIKAPHDITIQNCVVSSQPAPNPTSEPETTEPSSEHFFNIPIDDEEDEDDCA